MVFEINSEGIVSVAARDRETGQQQSIQVTASGGLTQDELKKILDEQADLLLEAKAGEEVKRRQAELASLISEVNELMPQLQKATQGSDFSADALKIATANALALGAKVEFVRSDWTASLETRDFDLIVSNPPYIAPDDDHLGQGDLRFEPRTALAAADAGLADLRRIIAAAGDLLRPGGTLLCEHGWDQAGSVRELVVAKGFTPVQYPDLAGIVRVTGGVNGKTAGR